MRRPPLKQIIDTSSGAGRPSIAVCVCTCNRAHQLAHALESVLTQSHAADEILVVDQSNGDETARVVAGLQTDDGRLRYVHTEQRGLSRAYNLAEAITSAELLAFTDDDCVAPPEWLGAIVRCFTEDGDIGLLYGQVLVPPSLQSRENVDGVTPALPIPRRRRLSRRDGYYVFGMGANFAIRRAVLQQLGGFDEVLGGGGPLQSAQDFDLSYRAFLRGQSILLAPEVIVHHYGFRSVGEWPQTVRAYGIGMGGFYGKHVRRRDLYATRLLILLLLRQTLRAARRSLTMRGGLLEWELLTYTLRGLKRSFQFAIDQEAMLYRIPGAGLSATQF